jgi:uncharacterized membrane protein YjjP (DUF1212 family)
MADERVEGTDRLRRGLRMALNGRRDPATGAGQRRRLSAGVSDLHTRKVLDLTIRLAEVMLSSGSGTADVVATARDVAQAYELADCVVDITFTTIIVSAPPTADRPPVTIMQSVRTRSTDYSRLAELDGLVRRITSGGVLVNEAHEAMDELTEQPHPYPRWLATAAWAGFALGIAMLMGGTWLTCIVAAVTSAIIDRVGRRLNRLGTPNFFQQAVGACIATLIAVVMYRFAGQGLTTLVATGIVVLLAGMTLVGSMQDALTGYMITALARLGDAVFATAGIVVGILAGLQVAKTAGIEIELHVDVSQTFITPHEPLPIIVATIGAVLAGVCLTLASYAPLRSMATAGIAAAIAALAFIGLGAVGFGAVLATGVAAIAVGLFATMISIRRQAPALVTVTAGITPLLPGLAVFRAVFEFAVEGDFDRGLSQMLSAAAIALAIGSGVVMGELIGSPLRYGAGRVSTILRIEGPPGLRRAVGGRVKRLRPANDQQRTGGPLRVRSVALELTPVGDADTSDSPATPDPVDDRGDGTPE